MKRAFLAVPHATYPSRCYPPIVKAGSQVQGAHCNRI
jgi:hypothetical protein